MSYYFLKGWGGMYSFLASKFLLDMNAANILRKSTERLKDKQQGWNTLTDIKHKVIWDYITNEQTKELGRNDTNPP